MITKDKNEHREQDINEILEKMIKEYENQYGLSGECVKSDWEHNFEYFSAHSDVEVENQDITYSINLTQEEVEMRIDALREMQQLIIEENLKNEAINTIENNEKVRYSILDVLELDRKRIARDLHDSSVQILTMLVHKAELCEKLIEIDTIRTKMELQVMSDVLKDAIAELRQTIFNLRPMTMDDLGIMDSIERYVQMLIQSSDIIFRLNIINEHDYDIEQLLRPVQKLSLYRVLQECCSNIVKHSGATNALITIKLGENSIELIVEDNGKGFKDSGIINKVNKLSNGNLLEKEECLDALTKVLSERSDFSGYGLSMLQERVYLLNGKLHIKTNNTGSKITVVIPVTTIEEDFDETN